MKKPINEPMLKHDNNAQFFLGILNAAWISAMLWGAGYLVYRYMFAVDEVVKVAAKRAGL